MIKCQYCDTLYCKFCPFSHKNENWACISFYESKCMKCNNPFFTYDDIHIDIKNKNKID